MMRHSLSARTLAAAVVCTSFLAVQISAGQSSPQGLDRVMTLAGAERDSYDLDLDRGSTGLWQQLQKLRTTASVLHLLAHPDDEHGGVLTYLSRGQGARVAQLTLNRGEGGANAIGPELFDALGLVRTEELLLAGAYYGLDDLYFTTLIDYGFSKTLDEALRNWGHENVLRDVVRVIRINRPLVMLARFHGSERDGHGHHHAAGVIAEEAFRAAGDPNVFPEQIRDEGLRPWQPLKLYRGGVREGEPWSVRIDAGTYSPWLGSSYRNVASRGLSFQRSQTAGAYREVRGPYVRYYERIDAGMEGMEKESGLFDGVDTTLPDLAALFGEDSQEAAALLEQIGAHVDDAVAAYRVERPADVVPHLVEGLRKTRQAIELFDDQSEVRFHLRIKEVQFVEAANTALGVRLDAVAVPEGATVDGGPWSSPPTMGVVVPEQTFRVETSLLNPSPLPLRIRSVRLEASSQWNDASPMTGERATIQSDDSQQGTLQENEHLSAGFDVTVPNEAAVSDRYYFRESIRESRYEVRDPALLHLPHRPPILTAVVDYEIEDVPIHAEAAVRTREADFPYGFELRELKIAPAVVVNVEPAMRVVSLEGEGQSFPLNVELVNNKSGPISGELSVEVPDGWNVEPARQSFSFTQAGERRSYSMTVAIPALEDVDYTIEAVAAAEGTEYRQGYDAISHPDNDTQYLYRQAVTLVRGVDVKMAPDLRVGYVMGVGDDVPSGIEQLGAEVQLLAANDLATADLSAYDAIVVGTRAYAVRQDLWTYNQRLLDYAQDGGNLVVLYQTPEFVPDEVAPFPAELPGSAEETSEEDAPVRILAPDHPVFNNPNQITQADFDGWVEQRGSKFFSEWDDAYTPMIETHDRGQEPQAGGWLAAEYGDGHYTYFAYAVHRQLPYAVPGAFRIFANVLSLGK